MLILLFLVGVTLSVPLPNPPQTPQSENAGKSSLTPTGRHIPASSSINEAYPTSTHLTPPVPKTAPNSGEVTRVHVTKEVRRVSFQIVEEVSGSKTLIYPSRGNHNSPDINLEPTEVEAPGTTPTTIPLATTTNPFNHNRYSNTTKVIIIHSLPVVEPINNVSLTDDELYNNSQAENSEIAVTKFDKYFNVSEKPSLLSSPHQNRATPKSILEPIVPSIDKSDRNTKLKAPAKDYEISEGETSTLKYFDVLLNDQPVPSVEKESLRVGYLTNQQPEMNASKRESPVVKGGDTSKSSQIKGEKYSKSTSTEKALSFDLENEEKSVDLILRDNHPQGQMQRNDDMPLRINAEYPSVREVKNKDTFINISPEFNLDKVEEEGTIKPSFIETRDTKTEAFFSVSKNENFPLNPNSNHSEKSIKHNLPSYESGQTEIIEAPSNSKDGTVDNIPPAVKRNSQPISEVGGSLDSYDQLEDHPPFADISNRDPALPIEDSEESTFLVNPRVLHNDNKGPIETGTQGYDGADENSSEEVKSRRIHSILHELKSALPSSNEESLSGSHGSVLVFRNFTRYNKAEIILPSSDNIAEARISGNSHLILDDSGLSLDDYTPNSLMDSPRQERVSVPVSEPLKEVMGAGSVAAIVLGAFLCIAAALGGFVFIVYHRQTDIRPKALFTDRSCANSDSGGYIDDHCRVAYVNSQLDISKGTPEDLVSLDNDSFLNSLESMTIQNLWTDSIRHTKL